MASYKRFNDEQYKNWLKTAESLSILRRNIRDFVEKETETYHKTLKGRLKVEICTSKCSLSKCPPKPKQFDICQICMKWKDEILDNHNTKKMDIHWNNCQPQLWPTDKWEVAKVYMLRGVQKHHNYDQFDISAILNFMTHCKHFKSFINSQDLTKTSRSLKEVFATTKLTKVVSCFSMSSRCLPWPGLLSVLQKIQKYDMVINVRNKVMHSPDFTLSKDDMDNSIKSVQQLAQILEKHAPSPKKISKELEEFNKMLEKYADVDSRSAEDSKAEKILLLEREQYALKKKIEFLAQSYEEHNPTELKEKLQSMKNFFDQNKDLLENFGPQIDQINEIQEKVIKHEQQIQTLNTKVDLLEKCKPDPVFSGNPLKYKNHVFEETRKRKMPEPVFAEDLEGSGYRGVVDLNGRTFKGLQICDSKKRAHQEVAKIALDYLTSLPEWTEEPSTSENFDSTTASTSSPLNTIFYASVTIIFNNQEVISDGYDQKEDATNSAYEKLANQFHLNAPDEDKSFKTIVLNHFCSCAFPAPEEQLFQQDNKNRCKLLLNGPFTFKDTNGFQKKKQSEQQAAKIALQDLSRILNCDSLDNVENYKGLLKERLEACKLKTPAPVYECVSKPDVPTTSSEDKSNDCSTQVVCKFSSLQPPKDILNVDQDQLANQPINTDECLKTKTQDCPNIPINNPKKDYTEIYKLLELYKLTPPSAMVESIEDDKKISIKVHINLDQFTFKNNDTYTNKKDAIRKTYFYLGTALGIIESNTDENQNQATMLVKQHFSQKKLDPPQEDFKDNLCSLNDVKYNLIYDGQGSTEDEAKQDALQNAHGAVLLLFGLKTLPKCNSVEEMETQINCLLNTKGQKDLSYSEDSTLHKITVQLLFKDYSMKSTSQRTKKENRNRLSERILALLGVDTDPKAVSFKYCLDEWFKKENQGTPVFEDTGEGQGSKAVFSVKMICSNPNWENSMEAAKEKLIQELTSRFQCLTN